MSTSFWLILCAGALGTICGYLLGCERVSRLRRQLNIARRQRDLAASDLRHLRWRLAMHDTLPGERAS